MADWQDIATAPRDRKVDLWAKWWDADRDRFDEQRFPDCRWDAGDSMCNRPSAWAGLTKGWHPTHWMDRPKAPPAVTTLYQPGERGKVPTVDEGLAAPGYTVEAATNPAPAPDA